MITTSTTSTIALLLTLALLSHSHAGGNIYVPKDSKYGTTKQYTKQQQQNRGTIEKKQYTTCRLMKRVKSRVTGRQACIYQGGNKTFTLMYEDDCTAKYKCVYNPGGKEPSIDDIIDSLNSIKK